MLLSRASLRCSSSELSQIVFIINFTSVNFKDKAFVVKNTVLVVTKNRSMKSPDCTYNSYYDNLKDLVFLAV